MLKVNHIRRFCRVLPTLQQPTGSSAESVSTSPKSCAPSNTNATQLWRQFHAVPTLQKYNKQRSKDEESDSEDEQDAEFKDERDSKVLKTKVNSLRADLLLKAGLGMARNKVETIFYESKIRVNGKKLAKKSAQLNVGDEIDVIRSFSHANPTHLIVARVIILSASEREEGYSVNLRRYKSLLVDNYKGVNAYKSSEAVQH